MQKLEKGHSRASLRPAALVTVQITQICAVTGLSKRDSMAVQNGGYLRAAWASASCGAWSAAPMRTRTGS
jgi:hypothetical protein